MGNINRTNIYWKNIFFIAVVILLPLFANAQSKETQQALQVSPDTDETVDSSASEQCCLIKKHSYFGFFNGDLGGCTVWSKTNGNTYYANGPTWAVAANLAYKIPSFNKKRKTFLSAGIELRNFNAIATETDRFGAKAYDNLHYWYAGIPVIFHILNTKYNPGKKITFSYFGQLGFTLAAKMNVTNVYSMQGSSNTYDISEHYTTFMFQPFISGGISCNTPACIYLIGPYFGYAANNLVTNTGISEHIFSYGLRLTTLFY